MRRRARGFTLIELMIVVAIIGILAAIALPKFAGLMRKSNEGAGKGNLASIRSALNVYYSNMEGQYPSVLAAITAGGQNLTVMPPARAPNYHADSSAETDGLLSSVNDAGGWLYDNVTADANIGSVLVNCTHTDTRGSVWTTY